MSDLYGLKLEPMPNKLVNYGVTENGIAVIELTSDSAGKPLDGPNDRSPNTYTHEMMRDIDEAVVRARFNDDVTCIVLTGNGASFFSAGASIQGDYLARANPLGNLDIMAPGYEKGFGFLPGSAPAPALRR